MSTALYGYAILGALGLAAILFVRGWLGQRQAARQGQAIGAAQQAGKDRADAILEAAKQGPEALTAEGAKITAELDAELGKKP